MNENIVSAVIRPKGRRSLFHFTRAANLPVMAHFDAMMSSFRLNPSDTGKERRLQPSTVAYGGQAVTINAHLRIADRMMEQGTTQEEFRHVLNRHVFFWPTLKDCRMMMDTYGRREPEGSFAVLELDAGALLSGHYSAVKLSKYDSGSSPRFPASCSYRKSPDMFLPLDSFMARADHTVPVKASEIKEVLVEDMVTELTKYLLAVYADRREDVPERWRLLFKPLANLRT
jgi:hypothetical protein